MYIYRVLDYLYPRCSRTYVGTFDLSSECHDLILEGLLLSKFLPEESWCNNPNGESLYRDLDEGEKELEPEVFCLGLNCDESSSRSKCCGMMGTQRLRLRI